jgi:hypothetical protein
MSLIRIADYLCGAVPLDIRAPWKSELKLRKYPVEGILRLFNSLQIFATLKNRYDDFKPPTSYHSFHAASVMSCRYQLLLIYRKPIKRSFQHWKQHRMSCLPMLCRLSEWVELLSRRMSSQAFSPGVCLESYTKPLQLVARVSLSGI